MSLTATISDAFNAIIGKPPRERSEAEIFLTDIAVPHKVYNDGSIFVPGNISLSNRPIIYENKKLPDFSKVYIAGDFRCDSLNLLSLKGCPPYVGGDFYASGNDITNLEGGPAYVGGKYLCAGNVGLTTLEDRAFKIGGEVNSINTRIGDYTGRPSAAELMRSQDALEKAKEKYDAIQQAKAYKKAADAKRPLSYDDMTCKELPAKRHVARKK